MPIDPVCGMEVEERSQYKSKVQGKEFYFCCPHCKTRFDKNPSKFKV